MKKKFTIYAVLAVTILGVGVFFTPKGEMRIPKEYTAGKIARINGQDLLFASNRQFVEVLSIGADDQLKQLSEIHGLDEVQAVDIAKVFSKPYLVVLTGRYLYRYDISDPSEPKIVFKRDLYDFHIGKYKIDYMEAMATNDKYIFTAGNKGIRRFMPDNLFVDKIYYYDAARGVAANDTILAVITLKKGQIYDIASGNLLKEVDLSNAEKLYRQPLVGKNGDVYFPSDNALVKVDASDYSVVTYVNPVDAGKTFSYAADSASGNGAVYANGFGVTKLDSNFQKQGYFFVSDTSKFGTNSWGVALESGATEKGTRIAVFAKTSVLWLDENLKLLDQYRYAPRYTSYIDTSTDLNIRLSDLAGSVSHKVTVSAYGYWPNEKVTVGFLNQSDKTVVKTDNMGFARADIYVPNVKAGRAVIYAKGVDSKLSYQITYDVQ